MTRARASSFLVGVVAILAAAGCGGGGKTLPPSAIAYLGVLSDLSKQAVFLAGSDTAGRVRLTRDATFMGNLSWSPDGSKLALINNEILFVMNADGSGLHRLTPDDAQVQEFAWSTDGTRIAYSQAVPGAGLTETMTVVDVGSRKLESDSPIPGGDPTWSPDGHRLASQRCRPADQPSAFDCDIWVSAPDGSDAHRLVRGKTDDRSPRWSPDGRQIAYRRYVKDGDWALELVDVATGRIRTIGTGVASVAWSRDGTLTFVRQESELWKLPPGGARARLISRLANACGLSISPSERKVAFLRPCRRNFEGLVAAPLLVARLDGSAARRIATNASEPVWRPVNTEERANS
jgi:dipeptidyl aminopeptidase/acylaminoacyl peptidase